MASTERPETSRKSGGAARKQEPMRRRTTTKGKDFRPAIDLLRRLGSRLPEVRARAEAELAAMSAVERDALLDYLRSPGWVRGPRSDIASLISIGLAGVLAAQAASIAAALFLWPRFAASLWITAAWTPICWLGAGLGAKRAAEIERGALLCIPRAATARRLGPMLLTYRRAARDRRTEAVSFLVELLETTAVDENVKLATLELAAFNRLLAVESVRSTPFELTIAVLQCAPVVGDAVTLRRLHHMAAAPSWMRGEGVLRRTAAESAERLSARLSEAAASGALLRPAAARPHEALLRPAAGSAGGSTETLLRAGRALAGPPAR